MTKSKFGRAVFAVLALACAAVIGTFVSLQQGPPGELTAPIAAQSHPASASVDTGAAAVLGSIALVAGLGIASFRSGGRLRSLAARSFDYMIAPTARLLSAAVRALVPTPHFTNSRP